MSDLYFFSFLFFSLFWSFIPALLLLFRTRKRIRVVFSVLNGPRKMVQWIRIFFLLDSKSSSYFYMSFSRQKHGTRTGTGTGRRRHCGDLDSRQFVSPRREKLSLRRNDTQVLWESAGLSSTERRTGRAAQNSAADLVWSVPESFGKKETHEIPFFGGVFSRVFIIT